MLRLRVITICNITGSYHYFVLSLQYLYSEERKSKFFRNLITAYRTTDIIIFLP